MFRHRATLARRIAIRLRHGKPGHDDAMDIRPHFFKERDPFEEARLPLFRITPHGQQKVNS